MAVRPAVFVKIGEGLRRDILRAMLTSPLAELLHQAELLGFTSHETTAAIGEAMKRASANHWERKI
jgi:hypothetical protein